MSLDSLSLALTQIQYLVNSLSKKTFQQYRNSIEELVAIYGIEAERHLLCCCLLVVDFAGGSGENSSSTSIKSGNLTKEKDKEVLQLLAEFFGPRITQPAFPSLLNSAIEQPLRNNSSRSAQQPLKISPGFIAQFCRLLRLTRSQEVVLRIALLTTCSNDVRPQSLLIVRQKLGELLKNFADQDRNNASFEGGLQESSPEVIHFILCNLLTEADHFGIGKDLLEDVLTFLRRDYPRELVPVILAPILYQEQGLEYTALKMAHETSSLSKNLLETSMADLILETGYTFTSSLEECRTHFAAFSLRDLSAASVSCAVSYMARTHTGLNEQMLRHLRNGTNPAWSEPEVPTEKNEDGQPSSWNMEVFVQIVMELAPSLNWEDVISELDHPGFLMKDRNGLRLLISALQLGLQARGATFPAELLYRPWSNAEGQLSLLSQILKNPDIFCIADYPHHPINVEILKSPPEPDNKKLASWKCLGLLETLLNLLENGGLYSQVQELLKEPVQHCPDVLVLGLLQHTQPMTKLRQELLSSLIPVFLGNHPNSAIILHHAWHAQSPLVKPLVMHAMAEWYMRAEHDQTRLSRILDVAQDLKALSMLLNVQRFPFVIDLSCLASRREYLKLDKWLTDKMREHGETFVSACVNFLHQRCPQISGKVKEETGLKPSQLPPDTLVIMLNCLQGCVGNVSQELSDTISTMITNGNVMNRARAQPPPGVLKPIRPGSGVGMEVAFPTGTMTSQLFPPPGVSDSLSGLTSSLGSMGLGPPTSTGFSVNIGSSVLGGTTPAPGSPGKLFPGISMLDSTLNPSTVGLGSSTNPNQGQNAFSIFPSLTGSGSLPGSGSSSTNPLGIGIPSSSMASSSGNGQSGIGGGSNMVSGSVGSPGSSTGHGPGRIGGMNPHLGQERRTGDISSAFADVPQAVSKDIEDETNSYFQRIYNQSPNTPTLTVDEVLELLKKFQHSTIRREKEIFDCMLRNLFEEYRFFPQYPDRELHITAQLFGGIMEHGLVTYVALGVALRYVLEAVRKPHATKMYYFGITALDRFRHRLKEYPQYCQHLASIPHCREFPPHLIEYIDFGSRGQEPPNRPHGPVLPQVTTVAKTVTPTTAPATTVAGKTSTTVAPIGGRPSIANATNIDTLLVASEKDDLMAIPPESVQDKVSFIFNNLSQINLTQKCDELKEIVSAEHWSWVGQYLVMKRASIEPNFHTLYSNFLDTLKNSELSRLVIAETFRNIKVLLRSDKGIANFSDRSLLKNLGHWLGLLMLAKNKPILQGDIDLKSILVEAYHKGQQELLYVVPFVAKVLESCAKSKVFKPPNPWTLGIMNVLAELHQEPDLKLNLKFEVEVLCKTLSIDIHDLKPAMVFKDPRRLSSLEPQLSQPQLYQPVSAPQMQMMQQQQRQLQQQQQIHQLQQHQEQQQPPPQLASSPAQMQSQGGSTTPTPAHPVQSPPEPRFSYLDINVTSLAGLAQHLVVNNNIPLLTAHPNLRILIRPAVERAVQECIHPVVDWSMKIALTTCEQIIKKDFSLDSDDSRMRAAAHHMVRSLSAGTALIRCRDHLLLTIATNLKTAFLAALQRSTNPQQKDLVEQAATLTAQDNVEPACAFIQKTAVEKSISEIDKRLATEFDLRKHARNEGRRYYDPSVFSYQAERMPEPIRLKMSGVTPQQATVYEEFARYIPGFLPVTERDAAMLVPKMAPSFTNDEIGVILEKVALELERYLQSLLPLGSSNQAVAIGSLLEAVMLARSSRDHGAHITLLQKAFEGLVESLTSFASGNDPEAVVRFRDAHLLVLKALQDPQAYGMQWTNRQVTRCWAECREEFRYNLDILDCLVRAHLMNLQQFDMQLASVLEQALNPTGVGSSILALGFAMQLVHVYLLEGPVSGAPIVITENDLANTIEILTRIATHARQPPEGLATILELLRAGHETGLMDRAPGGPGGPTALIHSGIAQARDYDDPHGLPEKTEYLLQEWVAMYHMPNAGRDSSKAFGHFVTQMSLHGVLKTDDLITRFFRLCTQFCVDISYRALASEPTADLIRSKAFHTLDAYVRLIALLIKHSGDANNGVTKVNLLNKVLGIVAGVLLQDQEVRGAEFQQLAYHRILIMLFLELNAPEQVLDSINFQALTAFCHTLHILRPAKAPGFSYAWLEIVSHRVFIGRLLSITPQQKGWGMYAQLLIDLFKFLAPFLRNAELSKPVSMLYKGTLRVLLVLLHDFPEFLCDYHYGFCDVIPPNCIQMRNLILSAFPRNMRLPDPFTPNLKVDMLPEISHAPRVLTHFAAMIQPPTLKKDLDSYLKTRGPVTFLSELRSVVQIHISSINIHVSPEPGMRYNLPLLNALVLYVGTQAIQSIQTKGLSPSMATIGHSSYMDIFQSLAVNLDTEGRYLFINAIANQLRYPNSHTHYFSCVLLCLFAEANSEAIQEQITRVLLERLIVNRPHPWGLLITFIELIKNPVFKFWNHEFVHCAPEIEKLFESVARSCMVQKQTPRDVENHD